MNILFTEAAWKDFDGQVVADILLRMQEAGEPYLPIGFIDDDTATESERSYSQILPYVKNASAWLDIRRYTHSDLGGANEKTFSHRD
jgi:hypothetical protein